MSLHSPSSRQAVLLMGPTGTGKTELALALAAELPMEIISVDSALVYRGLDIGTAKPEKDILAAVPHHLIDIRDPSERYSAGAFRRDALEAMADIHARGKVPLLAGGTLLYFRALSRGLAELPEASPAVRRALDDEAAQIGWPGMHERLAVVDPAAAARIHPNDGQRIQRALEVFEQTGVALSQVQQRAVPPAEPGLRYLRLALVPQDRNLLNENLDKRLKKMINKGFLSEVEQLFRRGDLAPDLPAIRSVGYRQLWQFYQGGCDLDEAIRKAGVATRRLAKRQLTWLRGEELDAIFDPFADEVATKVRKCVAQWLGEPVESL